MPRSLFLIALVLAAGTLRAQPAPDPAPRIVMNLAAHPDDEDGNTMAYYRHGENAVVHSIIYTRGEGGQNEIGPELYAALGAIRSAETERAARHLGTQVRFLNFDDFGFSKTAAETFERWGGEEEVTARLVYLIRKLKPDVLFTNHDTVTVGPRRQHGHHQAVGISAYRAMALAADPTFRADQLAEDGVDLWQPQRLFIRLWRGGQDTADVRLPVGDNLSAGGRSATDIAVEAVAEHRSQGFDLIAERFRRDISHFALLWEAPGAPPLPRNAIDLAAGLPPNPHAAAIDLAHLIDSGRAPVDPRFAITVSDSVAVPGEELTVGWSGADGYSLVLSGALDTTLTTRAGHVVIPEDATYTYPAADAQYERFVSNPPVQAAIYDEKGRIVHADHLPIEISPSVVLQLEEAVALPRAYAPRVLLRPGRNELTLTGTVFGAAAPTVGLSVRGEGRQILAETTAPLTPGADGGVQAGLSFELSDDIPPGRYRIGLASEAGNVGMELDGYVLPRIDIPDGLRVGFVRSYDATTEAALREMGVEVAPLDSLALARGDLADLHTVVVDIRGYLDRADLRAHNDRLLEWVRNGGHLVVTYHKTFEWNVEHFDEEEVSPAGFAPYPLRLGRDRVTDHASPVTVLAPSHPLFNRPNAIVENDWDGWVQERGLYFPLEYDERYLELLEMNDPGEGPLRSSTLLVEHGQGTYVYTALGWYRQLGAFVPGAYRLFANLVSLPLVDGRAAPVP